MTHSTTYCFRVYIDNSPLLQHFSLLHFHVQHGQTPLYLDLVNSINKHLSKKKIDLDISNYCIIMQKEDQQHTQYTINDDSNLQIALNSITTASHHDKYEINLIKRRGGEDRGDKPPLLVKPISRRPSYYYYTDLEENGEEYFIKKQQEEQRRKDSGISLETEIIQLFNHHKGKEEQGPTHLSTRKLPELSKIITTNTPPLLPWPNNNIINNLSSLLPSPPLSQIGIQQCHNNISNQRVSPDKGYPKSLIKLPSLSFLINQGLVNDHYHPQEQQLAPISAQQQYYHHHQSNIAYTTPKQPLFSPLSSSSSSSSSSSFFSSSSPTPSPSHSPSSSPNTINKAITKKTRGGTNNYKCQHVMTKSGQICGQTFRRSYDLTRHQSIHLKNRPLCSCHDCGKKFTRLDALRRHQRIQGHQ